MKVRAGFVSNSSSSSFILPIHKDQKIDSINIQKLLFADKPVVCAFHWLGTFQSSELADVVARDLSAATPNDEEALLQVLKNTVDSPNIDQFENIEGVGLGRINWDAYEQAREEFGKEQLLKIKQDFPEHNLYVLNYSDNEGILYATLEHGGVFDAIPHIVVGHH